MLSHTFGDVKTLLSYPFSQSEDLTVQVKLCWREKFLSYKLKVAKNGAIKL